VNQYEIKVLEVILDHMKSMRSARSGYSQENRCDIVHDHRFVMELYLHKLNARDKSYLKRIDEKERFTSPFVATRPFRVTI
jgi:hypothetical protein